MPRILSLAVGSPSRARHRRWRSEGRAALVILILTAAVAVMGQSNESGASTGGQSAIDLLPGVATVRSSILQAESLESLNQKLVSQLSSEADSRFVDNCASEPGQANDSPAAAACTYGDTSAPQVMVLYGDSYVEQWLPAFDALGKRYRFKVVAYVRYGCPFAAVDERDYLGSVDPGCATFRQNVISAINSMVPPPSVTVLAESHYQSELAPNGSTISLRTWANGIRWTLKQLDVRPLGVLLGVPFSMNNPDTCLSAHLTHIEVCATPVSQAYSVASDEDDASAVEASDAVVVHLSALFCGQRCPEVVGDQLVFADKAHIDEAYAREVTTALGSLIGCMGVEISPAQNPPGGVLHSLLGGATEPSLNSACAAVNSAPYNL